MRCDHALRSIMLPHIEPLKGRHAKPFCVSIFFTANEDTIVHMWKLDDRKKVESTHAQTGNLNAIHECGRSCTNARHFASGSVATALPWPTSFSQMGQASADIA